MIRLSWLREWGILGCKEWVLGRQAGAGVVAGLRLPGGNLSSTRTLSERTPPLGELTPPLSASQAACGPSATRGRCPP